MNKNEVLDFLSDLAEDAKPTLREVMVFLSTNSLKWTPKEGDDVYNQNNLNRYLLLEVKYHENWTEILAAQDSDNMKRKLASFIVHLKFTEYMNWYDPVTKDVQTFVIPLFQFLSDEFDSLSFTYLVMFVEFTKPSTFTCDFVNKVMGKETHFKTNL